MRVFNTFTEDLHAMAGWLKACGVTTVAMESTGVCWISAVRHSGRAKRQLLEGWLSRVGFLDCGI